MTSLPRFSVNNPVLINLLMTAMIVGGALAALTLVRQMFPESRPNRVMVSTLYPGATPAEVEKGITLKIEEAVKDLEGVETVESTITEGVSGIMIELESGYDDVDQAVNDVKAAIDAIPREDWPEEALETRVSKFDPLWPVISISLYGDLDERTLKTYAEELRDDVLALPEISEVSLGGVRRDEISVEVDPQQLIRYDLSFLEVAEAIRGSNLDLPGGEIRTPEANISVRTLGERERAEDLGEIVLRALPTGEVVRVQDVATVVDGFEEDELEGRFLGKLAIDLTVNARNDQDSVQIANMIKALAAGKTGQPLERPLQQRLVARLTGNDPVREVYEAASRNPYPEAIQVAVHRNLSRYIEGRLDLLQRNGFWGLWLVFLSLLLFLNWRVALWVMMGLFIAIMGSMIGMSLLGQTLNLLSMFGLIVVLGMLVDDGIIVAENVYTKIEEGLSPHEAAIQGTEEVTWPVICAILTTMVAFIPLMYIEGQMGDWMGVLPIVVVIALSVSLIEAFTVLPAHLAHNLRPISREVKEPTSRIGRLWYHVRTRQHQVLHAWLLARYERLLRLATRWRYVTMACLLGALIATGGLVAGGHVPFVFIQKMDSETLFCTVQMDVGAPAEATSEACRVVEQAATKVPELESLYTMIGAQLNDDMVVAAPQSHVAQLFLELVPGEERERDSEAILAELREATAHIPGVRKLRFEAVHGGPGGAPIQLEISGAELDDLAAIAEVVKADLQTYDGVYDIVDDFDEGRREVKLELLGVGKAMGLTTEQLALQVRSAFYGFEARKVQRGPGGRPYHGAASALGEAKCIRPRVDVDQDAGRPSRAAARGRPHQRGHRFRDHPPQETSNARSPSRRTSTTTSPPPAR
jgi:HAE1 family hydrophobic/amphiphilic exporter-1